ncbi:glycerol-3-phosphate 1-O-acyltransferase PlsY [Candidatus Liberibacter brunswickensis]|uniref:glycerol-3-phosphate 1-O-acyltransferase PlsY n=1 Tax=Candidatus Liberibacter brunswickensis TaxID=1968796 RepID=UPI002FE18392
MDNLQFASYQLIAQIISIIISYIIGSIPFGLLLTRVLGFKDIRSIGSGNIGATNVLRTSNKKIAFTTLVLDALKATVTIIIISKLFDNKVGCLAGLATFLGHIFPVWLKFKGGKGVSTYIGFLIALAPNMAELFIFVWISSFVFTGYSSISSLLSTLIIAIVILIKSPEINISIIFTFMTIVVYWKHIENIKRLIIGSEKKIILNNKNFIKRK